MASTSVVPKLPRCLQEEEEEKESDSDSEGPIQYRDEEDEEESHHSKKGKSTGENYFTDKAALSKYKTNGNRHSLPSGHLVTDTGGHCEGALSLLFPLF